MLRYHRRSTAVSCALALLAACAPIAVIAGNAAHPLPADLPANLSSESKSSIDFIHGEPLGLSYELESSPRFAAVSPMNDKKTLSLTAQAELIEAHTGWPVEFPADLLPEPAPGEPASAGGSFWSWQWAPTGLIYRSYLAGPHEPHMSLVTIYTMDDRTLWDATLGARVGIVRYGDCDPLRPQGFQLDFYGAAVARLDVEHRQDLESTDYVFGFPLTYGVDDWQFKFGYAHLSSHLGDERAIRVDDSLDERINYVRDGFVLGASHYPYPFWRQYSEVGWAFNTSGGAGPWDAQFGAEFSAPGPTGASGSPYLAVNGRLREEHNFGGDFAVQTGWLRRGDYGQVFRVGLHFFTGKSSQFQFFDNSEEQIGLGVWYDL